VRLPRGGRAFISVRDGDKPAAAAVARDLAAQGFTILASRGTARVIQEHGVAVTPVNKVTEGRPHIVDMIKNGEVSFIVNTVEDTRTAIADSRSLRTTALAQRVTYYTTIAGAKAACEGMKHVAQLEPYRLQDLHARLARNR
jgi:carbamoyl-phosphate synthase large subunit